MNNMFAIYLDTDNITDEIYDHIFLSMKSTEFHGIQLTHISKGCMIDYHINEPFMTDNNYFICKDKIFEYLHNRTISKGDLLIGVTNPGIATHLFPSLTLDNVHLSYSTHIEYHDLVKYTNDYVSISQVAGEYILEMYNHLFYKLENIISILEAPLAAVIFDAIKHKFFIIHNYKNLHYAYIEGFGVVVHTDYNVVDDIRYLITGKKIHPLKVLYKTYQQKLNQQVIEELRLDTNLFRTIKVKGKK